MAGAPENVHEFQGLYGPFTLAERVVQKIWMRRDFDTEAPRLLDGRSLRIDRPGNWNLLAGPDFRDARLAIDGREVAGDVEVHFHATDWRAHGHDADPAYDGVVLHVVMFPPTHLQAVAHSRHGVPLPTLVLLPLLNRGLEEYASDDALENLTARDAAEKLAELSVLPRARLREELLERSRRRWQQRLRFARLRLQSLGWEAACHHAALEVLGYRRNRAPMLAVAARYPLAAWTTIDPDEVHRQFAGAWQTQGVRPANHPRRRLAQYARWIASSRDWPQRVAAVLEAMASLDSSIPVGEARRQWRLVPLREKMASEWTGRTLGGTRLDNLVCDGLLPLMAAQEERDFHPLWFNWFPGDLPAEVRRGLVALGLAGRGIGPQCQGWAQGLLAWILERDARASG